MPAIQLGHLKVQAAHLAETIHQPAAFVRGLHKLLDFYADRSHRPGRSGEPHPLLPSYNAPPPVLRQVLLEVTPRVREDLLAALALCDTLWSQEHYDCRYLAAGILGSVSADFPDPVLDRVQNWVVNEKEDRLITAILNLGLARFRRERPFDFLRLIEGWLTSSVWTDQQIGLRALLPLVEDPGFQNLPFVYRVLTPLARKARTSLRPDLAKLMLALANRSPQETVYFLRQNLAAPDNPDTAWLARRVLKHLPAEAQTSLRLALDTGPAGSTPRG